MSQDYDVRASVAEREAEQFEERLLVSGVWPALLYTLILSAMAYFRVANQWLIVVAFVGLSGGTVAVLAKLGKRFETRLSYLDQICTVSNERLIDMRVDALTRG